MSDVGRKDDQALKIKEEKCSIEEKRFAKIVPESVIMMAEASGCTDLPMEVAVALADDVTYRLREFVHICGQRLRHSKRRKLTSDDLNAVLSWCDVPCIYGHSSTQPLAFKHVKDANVFVEEDKEIDLIDIATSNTPLHQMGPTFVKAEWFQPEPVNKSPDSDMSSLSPDFKMYYTYTTKAILGPSKDTFKVVLNDLATNRKITPLLSHFISFITASLKKLNHNEIFVERMLLIIQVLARNPALNLGRKPFLNHLVSSVLFCLVKPLSHSAKLFPEKCSIQDCAAKTLVQILERWNNNESLLRLQTLRTLQGYINDRSKPMMWYHGVLTALGAIGGRAVEEYLYPCLPGFIDYLASVLKGEETTPQVRYQVQLVYGAMRSAIGLALTHKMCEVFSLKQPSNLQQPTGIKMEIGGLWNKFPGANPNELYQFAWTQFGDSMAPHVFPPPPLSDSTVPTGARREDHGNKPQLPKRLAHKSTWDHYTFVGGRLTSSSSSTKNLNLEVVFQRTPLRRPRYLEVSFNFAGSIPVPVHRLRRRRLDPFQTQWKNSGFIRTDSLSQVFVGKEKVNKRTGGSLLSLHCIL